MTSLAAPGLNCAVTDALTTPFALVKFPAQSTRSVAFQHHESSPGACTPASSSGEPLPNPCAATLCPTDQICVVLESNPPKTVCQPPPAPVDACTSALLEGNCASAEALKEQAAEICTQQKLALADFGLGSACFVSGFAEAKFTCCHPTPVPPPVCATDSDCTLRASYCAESPCTCQAAPGKQAPGKCDKGQVACLVDPCAGKSAVCSNGQCTITPPPPPSI